MENAIMSKTFVNLLLSATFLTVGIPTISAAEASSDLLENSNEISLPARPTTKVSITGNIQPNAYTNATTSVKLKDEYNNEVLANLSFNMTQITPDRFQLNLQWDGNSPHYSTLEEGAQSGQMFPLMVSVVPDPSGSSKFFADIGGQSVKVKRDYWSNSNFILDFSNLTYQGVETPVALIANGKEIAALQSVSVEDEELTAKFADGRQSILPFSLDSIAVQSASFQDEKLIGRFADNREVEIQFSFDNLSGEDIRFILSKLSFGSLAKSDIRALLHRLAGETSLDEVTYGHKMDEGAHTVTSFTAMIRD
jgi:hypothetical protein